MSDPLENRAKNKNRTKKKKKNTTVSVIMLGGKQNFYKLKMYPIRVICKLFERDSQENLLYENLDFLSYPKSE